MLVYARVDHKNSLGLPHPVNGSISSGASQPNGCQPIPPAKALEVVSSLNTEHRRVCEEYTRRSVVFRSTFPELTPGSS